MMKNKSIEEYKDPLEAILAQMKEIKAKDRELSNTQIA